MNNVTKLKFKDEDGGDDGNEQSELRIIPCDNGYLLETYDDEEEIREVYIDKSELLKRLEELL